MTEPGELLIPEDAVQSTKNAVDVNNIGLVGSTTQWLQQEVAPSCRSHVAVFIMVEVECDDDKKGALGVAP